MQKPAEIKFSTGFFSLSHYDDSSTLLFAVLIFYLVLLTQRLPAAGDFKETHDARGHLPSGLFISSGIFERGFHLEWKTSLKPEINE